MGSIKSNGGFRYNANVMSKVLQDAGGRIGEEKLLETAKLLDGGNRYLNETELRAALAVNLDRPTYEKLLALPQDEFAISARTDKARTGGGIPQLAALAFDGTAGGAKPSDLAAMRDERMDRVAEGVAEKLGARRGWKASVIGGERGQPDVIGGALPKAYGSSDDARTYGEAYNLLELKIPGVGEETMALVFKREHNEWTDSSTGAPSAYVQEEAELMLAFVDPSSLKLHGSGYVLDGDDGKWWDSTSGNVRASARELFSPTTELKVDTMIESLVDEIVENLLEFKDLND